MNKSKLAIILPCNIYTAPFLHRYEEVIKQIFDDYDLIYWNRALIDEESIGNQIRLNLQDKVNSGKWIKIIKYIKFGRFVKKNLMRNKYEKIIVLGSYAGIMYQLSRILEKYYKNCYWLDIRDYTFENFRFYYNGMGKVIRSSYATAISSKGYKKFLPNYNYVIAHNIDYKNIENAKKSKLDPVKFERIRISFIGLVRYYEENIKLLEALRNDDRYVINYFGMNSDFLKDYCIKNNIANVNFHGRFDPSKTAYFYTETDIINNIYGNEDIALTTALSNKLYYSVFLNIPILVSPNTYMEEIATENGIGYTVDWNADHLGDDLYEWFQNFNINKRNRSDKLKESILEEDEKFEIELINFLRK